MTKKTWQVVKVEARYEMYILTEETDPDAAINATEAGMGLGIAKLELKSVLAGPRTAMNFVPEDYKTSKRKRSVLDPPILVDSKFIKQAKQWMSEEIS